MSAEKTITESLGDFAALLTREISQALALARYEAPFIEVERVRVCFGQEEVDSDSVIVKRYPFLTDGWDVEMEMGSTVHARLHGKELPVVKSRQLLDVFRGNQLSDIKGINTDWAAFFARHKVRTIGSLASISMAELQNLARERRSVKLWEFHGKARLLESELPFFPPTSLDNEKLYTLLKMAPDEIMARVGARRITAVEIERIAAVMEVLAIVLDSKVLRLTCFKKLIDNIYPRRHQS